MKRTKLAKIAIVPAVVAGLVSPSIVANAAPVTTKAPVVAAVSADANAQIRELDALVQDVQNFEAENAQAIMQASISSRSSEKLPNYANELKELMNTAFELKGTITAAISGELLVDPAQITDFVFTIPARIQLLKAAIDTVKRAIADENGLRNKPQWVQWSVGLAITKASIRILNPLASTGDIQKSLEELAKDMQEGLAAADRGDNDRANIYDKSALNKVIWNTRFERDRHVLGKAKFADYNALNKEITKAVGVWFRVSATYAEVKTTMANLELALTKAKDAALRNVNKLPKK
ncbi:CAMP factor family pore-forming toxin [Arcanobacterium hippocoleae]|uniref:CAMP factor family pore-forming toxin n=1 Tax=Arcanobacterium hippocoleae TaxID=149017 RepID=UPI00333F6642